MLVETKIMSIPLPADGFRLEKGGRLRRLEVAYETYGERSPDGDNVVYICHALTGDAHVAGRHSETDPKPGWWDEMVGPGKGIDTGYYFVVCANILGGCRGTTGPASLDPATGRSYGSSFPEITVGDMVQVQKMLLDELGVTRLAAVVGGSLGGMQALEWSVRFPEWVERCICIASGTTLSAQALAFDAVARDAIRCDPAWNGGDYYGRTVGPEWGLAHARKIGHITYLSPELMQRKFGRVRMPDGDGREGQGGRFQVEGYLDYQGRKLVRRFDANSYLAITQAMDSYDLAEHYGPLDKAFAAVRSKFLVVALSSDWLFPPEQTKALASALLRAGKNVSCCTLVAPYGHDAFLIDIDHLADTIRAFLPWVTPRRLAGNGGGRPAERSRQTAARQAAEYGMIRSVVRPGSRVLDLGCGDGSLLSLLAAERGTSGVGVDIDLDNVIRAIDAGHDVLHGDLDRDLSVIPDDSYDYAILSGTLQQVKKPKLVVREMLRVARESIIVFPNFAHWRNRMHLALRGRMPKSEVLPYEWYETPNIHLATLADVLSLCSEEGVAVLGVACCACGSVLDRLLVRLGLRNLGARKVLIRISRNTAPRGP